MGTFLAIEEIRKRYAEVEALAGVSLQVQGGEFFTLLGPSGCGKTTLLRCIAGFLRPDGGRILCDGERLDTLPAHRRDIGMVFQNYAIFPHLTVFENVAYGLRARRVPPEDLRRRVAESLQLVQMEALAGRRPDQLSGGQQQRVALARAMAIQPRLLLMDEPLSNLDAKLRVEMRTEIRRLQRELGTTTIYVTHDQEEALAISERLAVMNAGRVEQVGFPWDVYQGPQSAFVAQFIGTSNTLAGRVVGPQGEWTGVDVGGWILRARRSDGLAGRALAVFRPEAVSLLGESEKYPGATPGQGVVVSREFLGSILRYRLRLSDGSLIHVDEHKPDAARLRKEGEQIRFAVHASDVMLFPAKES
ncbi:MAG TPA: ABC transporter ATP-binding protein [Candidatus Methylomirabilis sp.]|nr:ABC transporter ATP-binding protein [Candidatus Methylomirabilis sp.]